MKQKIVIITSKYLHPFVEKAFEDFKEDCTVTIEDYTNFDHITDIYRKYATFGGLSINIKSDGINDDLLYDSKFKNITKESLNSINDFILYLASMDPWTLVDYSHRVGGAWYKSYNKDKTNVKISNKLIEQEANS